MAKIKKRVTKKFIRDRFKNIICIDYCKLQYLLRYRQPDYYTADKYGWNADVFVIDGSTAIVTGYRPFGNIIPNRDDVKYYNETAEGICRSFNGEERETILSEQLDTFAWSTVYAGH